MSRKPFVPTTDPYHISARCVNREWFILPTETVWSIMEDYLCLIAHVFELRIHAFVLMSNHFHLLVTAPKCNLSAAMRYFMRETSREITRLSARINQTYGNRHHKTQISVFQHFMSTYKYVYRNPVRAKICTHVEEYRFSTLHGLMGKSRLVIPIDESILFNDFFDWSVLDWLNSPTSAEDDEDMRKALRHPRLEFKTKTATGKQSRLASSLL